MQLADLVGTRAQWGRPISDALRRPDLVNTRKAAERSDKDNVALRNHAVVIYLDNGAEAVVWPRGRAFQPFVEVDVAVHGGRTLASPGSNPDSSGH